MVFYVIKFLYWHIFLYDVTADVHLLLIQYIHMPLFLQRNREHKYFYWRKSNVRRQFRLTCKFHMEHVLLLRFAWTYVYCTTIVRRMNGSSGHHTLRMAPILKCNLTCHLHVRLALKTLVCLTLMLHLQSLQRDF